MHNISYNGIDILSLEKTVVMERKSFIINIDKRLAEEVDAIALGNNLTGNEMVEVLLRYGVQNPKNIGRIVKTERETVARTKAAAEAASKTPSTKSGPISLRPLAMPTTGPRSTTAPAAERPVSANKLHPGVPTFKIPQMPRTTTASPAKAAPEKTKSNSAPKNGK